MVGTVEDVIRRGILMQNKEGLDVLLKSARKFYMKAVGTEPPDDQVIKDWTIALLCAIVKYDLAVPTLSCIVLGEVWEENK